MLDRSRGLLLGLSLLWILVVWGSAARSLIPPTGDEPYYLLMAQSLLSDGDLDLTDEYAGPEVDRIYPPRNVPPYFTWTELLPHTSQDTRPPGRFSKHSPGLSLLILPGYALAGLPGARLTVALFYLLLLWDLWHLGREVGGDLGAWGAWALLGLSPPFSGFGPLLFPALPAAALALRAYRRLRERVRLGEAGLALALLPWLHPRLLALALPLALGLAGWGRRRTRSWLVPLLLGWGGLALFYLWLYGHPWPNPRDHQGFAFGWGTFLGLWGLLVDRQWGLLPHAPVYLLAALGLLAALVDEPPWPRGIFLLLLPYALLVASYRVWWGEWGPPARYWVPLLPFLAEPGAWALRHLTRRGLGILAPLALWSWGISFLWVLHPWWRYGQPDGLGFLWGNLPAVLSLFFPSLVTGANQAAFPYLLALILVWLALLVWGFDPDGEGRMV